MFAGHTPRRRQPRRGLPLPPDRQGWTTRLQVSTVAVSRPGRDRKAGKFRRPSEFSGDHVPGPDPRTGGFLSQGRAVEGLRSRFRGAWPRSGTSKTASTYFPAGAGERHCKPPAETRNEHLERLRPTSRATRPRASRTSPLLAGKSGSRTKPPAEHIAHAEESGYERD